MSQIQSKRIKTIANNKKAYFDYFIEEKFEAGLVLTGTEIKSIRASQANLTDSYCQIKRQEVFILNMHVSPYSLGTIYNHEPKRTRKLLLNKREIIKLSNATQRDGYTLVPLCLYLSEGLAKLEIGLAKGKKNYDKRETLKEKEIERNLKASEKY